MQPEILSSWPSIFSLPSPKARICDNRLAFASEARRPQTTSRHPTFLHAAACRMPVAVQSSYARGPGSGTRSDTTDKATQVQVLTSEVGNRSFSPFLVVSLIAALPLPCEQVSWVSSHVGMGLRRHHPHFSGLNHMPNFIRNIH